MSLTGAAVGVQSALADAIKQQLLLREAANREQQVASQAENNAISRDIQRQNAESLQLNRQSMMEEREARMQALQQKNERAGQMRQWAAQTLQSYDPSKADPNDWESALSLARARNIMATGEDLPDQTMAQIYASHYKQPVSKIKTPEEIAQEKEMIDYRARVSAANRPPREPSAARERYEDMKTAKTAVNNYLSWLMKDSGGDLGVALQRFDDNPEVAIRKAGGMLTLPEIRAVLASYKGKATSPAQQLRDEQARLRLEALKNRPTFAGRGEQ